MVCGLVSGARKPIRIEPDAEAADLLGVGRRDLDDDVAAPDRRRRRRVSCGARLGEGGVRQQRVGARAALHDHLEAFGLQLADDLRHERHPVLARRGLLRNTDPHARCENVSHPHGRRGGPGVRDSMRPMTVNLTRIYTKLGDGGETHLGDMSRVSKLHPRVEAYGTVDELNATRRRGAAAARPARDASPRGSAACRTTCSTSAPTCRCPRRRGRRDRTARLARERLRVAAEYTEWLEGACDEVNATLAPLRSFVIPGGTPGRGAPARLPHRLPPSRAARDRRRRGGQPGGRALPEPALGPAVHPRPRRQRGRTRRRSEPLWDPGAHGAGGADAQASRRQARRGRARPRALGGAQAGDGQRHPQRGHQIAADHVARHVPGEDQQRAADGRRERRAQPRRRPGAAAAARRAPRTARARAAAVAWPLGHDAATMSVAADLHVGMGEQRLERSRR